MGAFLWQSSSFQGNNTIQYLTPTYTILGS